MLFLFGLLHCCRTCTPAVLLLIEARRCVVWDGELLTTFALQAGGEGGAPLARKAGVPISPEGKRAQGTRKSTIGRVLRRCSHGRIFTNCRRREPLTFGVRDALGVDGR